jgi:hypothetical protein
MITQNEFAGASMDVLASFIDKRVNQIIEMQNTVRCVARGGESHANSINSKGDPIDSLSGGIFRSIANTMEGADAQHMRIELLAAINELRCIAVQQPALS